MTTLRTTQLGALAVLLALAATPASAQAPPRTQAGTLACNLGPSVGLIIGSRQRMIAGNGPPSDTGRNDVEGARVA